MTEQAVGASMLDSQEAVHPRVERVLHIVGAMNRGGAETMLMTLYRAIDRTQWQFDFLEFSADRSDYADEITELGGRLVKTSWSQAPLRMPRTVQQLVRVLKSYGPFHAVHSHILFGSGAALVAAGIAGVPIRIAHSHSTSDSDGPLDWVYQQAARCAIRSSATRFAACSGPAGAYLFGSGPFRRLGVLIPNAVDLDEFTPVGPLEKSDLRQQLGLPIDSLIAVSIARMEPVKNHGFLLRLAARMRDQSIDFTLLLVGAGSLREQLEAETRALQLEDRVRFLGLRDDVATILRCADFLLLPSHFEGLPVVLVEAQASGVPCLVSDKVTEDSDLGLGLLTFLPISDVDAWAEELKRRPQAQLDAGVIRSALSAQGYGVHEGLQRLMELYRPAVGT